MTTLQRWTQAIIAGAMGVYLVGTLVSGTITNYIAVKFTWLTWIAAGILLLLAGIMALTLIAQMLGKPAPAHDHDHAHDHVPHDHHHAHTSRGTWRGWIGLGIVALPVMFGVLVPSQPLGSRAVDSPITSDFSSISAASAATRLDIAPQNRTILDWINVFTTARDPEALRGQPAEVVGFVYRDARILGEADRFMVARFVMSCCAADAQAIGLVVYSDDAAALREDSWVRVRGTIEIGEFDGVLVPSIVVDDQGIETIDQPQNPYLYP